jgi:hypothetical protein
MEKTFVLETPLQMTQPTRTDCYAPLRKESGRVGDNKKGPHMYKPKHCMINGQIHTCVCSIAEGSTALIHSVPLHSTWEMWAFKSA